jgi:hypothetical protein
MAKNLVMQGSNAAMMSATSKPTLNVANGSPEIGVHGKVPTHFGFFTAPIVAVFTVGALVIPLTVWPSSLPGARPIKQRNGILVADWILQPLVTGNLAICLLWVWLDRAARLLRHRNAEVREILLLVTLFVISASIVICLCTAVTQVDDMAIAIVLYISVPILAVSVPLLWLAVGWLASLRLRALVLAGFVVASAFAQKCAKVAPDAGDETNITNIFVPNSYLIGLAVAIWLMSWTTKPHATRTA